MTVLYKLISFIIFYSVLLIKHAPLELFAFKSNDRPWVTPYFKKLILQRNEAFSNHKSVQFKKLRNKVNRIRKSLQTQYYLDRIDHLKNDNPAKWWKNLKTICKLNNKVDSVFDTITRCDEIVPTTHLPDVLNDFFVSVGNGLPALDLSRLAQMRLSLGPVPDKYIVDPLEVFTALSKMSLNKSPGPDLIPNKILKDLSFILAEPLCALINSSVRQGVVPDCWKISRITPLPKQYPPTTVEQDIRPIAITNTIAKVAEKFIARWFNEHFDTHLDASQFGCTTNRSTTHALIKLTHEIFRASENSNNISRILFVDFSKHLISSTTTFCHTNLLTINFHHISRSGPYLFSMIDSNLPGLMALCLQFKGQMLALLKALFLDRTTLNC